VLVPVFNEGGNVGALAGELRAALALTGLEAETIWVDDGSTDGTLAELRAATQGDATARVSHHGSRCGQSAALWAGFQVAKGAIIATLDGDGQNDPADIPAMLSALATADMVIGFRKHRKDSLMKRAFARVANFVRKMLTGSRLPDSGCGLRIFRRHVLYSFLPFDGMHRFLPTMAEIAGLRVVSLDVNHRPRTKGESKYGILDRTIGPLLDCLMLRRLKSRRMPIPSAEWVRSLDPRPDSIEPARNETVLVES